MLLRLRLLYDAAVIVTGRATSRPRRLSRPAAAGLGDLGIVDGANHVAHCALVDKKMAIFENTVEFDAVLEVV